MTEKEEVVSHTAEPLPPPPPPSSSGALTNAAKSARPSLWLTVTTASVSFPGAAEFHVSVALPLSLLPSLPPSLGDTHICIHELLVLLRAKRKRIV